MAEVLLYWQTFLLFDERVERKWIERSISFALKQESRYFILSGFLLFKLVSTISSDPTQHMWDNDLIYNG